MNIEKIKNYNQRMLAVLSTMLVILAAIGLISVIVFLIDELIPRRYPNHSNALLSDEKVNELKEDSLRKQIISYDDPYLLDTLNLIYLIPVNVKMLDNPERIEKEIFSTPSFKYASADDEFTEGYFYGTFNNILVFDYPLNKTTKICDTRMLGSDMSFAFFKDEIIIAFTGTQKDTNQDGQITTADFQSLYLYSLNEKKLRQVNYKNSTVTSFKRIETTKDILISFCYDRNSDNIFDNDTEPTFIMKYNYRENSLTTVVDKALEKELQKIIDKN